MGGLNNPPGKVGVRPAINLYSQTDGQISLRRLSLAIET
jgi:hypothetical protein